MILHRRSACTQTWLVIGIWKRSLFLQRCHNWLPSPLSVASIVWANPSFSERFSLTETLICLKTWSTEAALCRWGLRKRGWTVGDGCVAWGTSQSEFHTWGPWGWMHLTHLRPISDRKCQQKRRFVWSGTYYMCPWFIIMSVFFISLMLNKNLQKEIIKYTHRNR